MLLLLPCLYHSCKVHLLQLYHICTAILSPFLLREAYCSNHHVTSRCAMCSHFTSSHTGLPVVIRSIALHSQHRHSNTVVELPFPLEKSVLLVALQALSSLIRAVPRGNKRDRGTRTSSKLAALRLVLCVEQVLHFKKKATCNTLSLLDSLVHATFSDVPNFFHVTDNLTVGTR